MNLDEIQKLADNGIETIDYAVLYEKRIIRQKGMLLKILGRGNLSAKVSVMADAYSASAKDAIERVGGTANV